MNKSPILFSFAGCLCDSVLILYLSLTEEENRDNRSSEMGMSFIKQGVLAVNVSDIPKNTFILFSSPYILKALSKTLI